MKQSNIKALEEHSSDLAGTADQLLQVAEELFASRGYHGASIRDITNAAQTNLGAVTYHFRTKENLLATILERGATALNRRRSERFDLVEQGASAPSLKELLRAFIEPTFALLETPSGVRFLRIQDDIGAERTDVPRDVIAKHYDPIARRFMRLLAKAAPHLSPDELVWSFHFILGALMHSLTRAKRFATEAGDSELRENEREALVNFVSNALRPPCE